MAQAGADPRRVLDAGSRAMLRQIFEFGLLHADPHPGNLLVLPGAKVAFLDFGVSAGPIAGSSYGWACCGRWSRAPLWPTRSSSGTATGRTTSRWPGRCWPNSAGAPPTASSSPVSCPLTRALVTLQLGQRAGDRHLRGVLTRL
ncbi:AarF/UbiB family protein [Pseudonocardia sp. RS010]|uniref:AarF/UbiB family protein n=1 Tax=Pseudonocardia sp. RS010 TaxID=3385979 RepID=UPI0039A298FB